MLYNTFRQYEYIVAVAAAGSLTDAAIILNISQPSLSVAISRVEERLGRDIFLRRKGSPIVITPFGHRFVEQAQELLKNATNLEHFATATHPFVLGCFEDIAPWYLPKAVKTLSTQIPSLNFQGQEGQFSELATAIQEGQIDLAISYDVGFDNGFQRKKIKEVSPVAFVSVDHPFAALPTLELQQLEKQPLIFSTEDLSEGYLRRLFSKINMRPIVAHKAKSLEMMRSLAAHNEGIGISYSCPPTQASYDGQPLVTIPITTLHAVADIVLIWSNLREKDAQLTDILHALSAI